MRIEDILLDRMGDDLEGIHRTRLRVVFAAAAALLRAGRSALTSIGRAIATQTTQKHGIKRVDRLLGNEHLKSERLLLFRALARRVVAPGSRPVVIVDWTDFSPKLWMLVAAVSFQGRAVVIYSEVHPVSRYLKPALNRMFLLRLREVLPAHCNPIIVTDAGFRSPWMREVSRLGWDYICRLRGLVRIREAGRTGWSKLIHFFARMSRGARDFGICELGRRVRFRTRVVGFSKRGRRTNWQEKWGELRRSDYNKQLRSAREPWILATSLKSSPRKVAALYRRRMQIEETFRDTKSPHYGLGMKQARTTSRDRANVLMLIACLAHLLSILAGLIAEATRMQRDFQANTVTRRRVLSLSRLGRLVLNARYVFHLPTRAVITAWNTLSDRTYGCC